MVKETYNKENISKVEVHKKQYFDKYDWEDTHEKDDSRHNGYIAHKANTNMNELVYYLEEMYQLELLDEIETDIYERYMWGDRITSSDRMYVYEKAYEYFFEKF